MFGAANGLLKDVSIFEKYLILLTFIFVFNREQDTTQDLKKL
jgi:hypothetical protein